ncbi:MAG: hypothetical protein ACI8YB_000917 [Patiriisocius sp.]|jgi:hypothetical protein
MRLIRPYKRVGSIVDGLGLFIATTVLNWAFRALFRSVPNNCV